MKTSGFVLGGALLLAGLELSSVQAVRAQEAPLSAKSTLHVVRVRNVPARLMAFWLDPKNNPLPDNIMEEATKKAEAPVATSPRVAAPQSPPLGVFALPSGIERITANDARGALLILGTDEAVEKLQPTIAFLDQPLRQVEVEAQFVRVAASDTSAFGIDFTMPRGNFNTNGFSLTPPAKPATGMQIGFVRGNFQATLAALQKANRAEVVSAPRVTAINDLTAKVGAASFSPAVIGIRNESGEFVPLLDPTAAPQKDVPAPQIGVLRQFEVTPTINNNDTVTLLMSFSTTLQLQNGTQAPVALQVPAGLVSVVNVRDGETIALGGFDPSFVAAFSPQEQAKTAVGDTSFAARFSAFNQIPTAGKVFRNRNPYRESELIVFITARIVRRVGEAVK